MEQKANEQLLAWAEFRDVAVRAVNEALQVLPVYVVQPVIASIYAELTMAVDGAVMAERGKQQDVEEQGDV